MGSGNGWLPGYGTNPLSEKMLTSVGFCDTHLRPMSHEIRKNEFEKNILLGFINEIETSSFWRHFDI